MSVTPSPANAPAKKPLLPKPPPPPPSRILVRTPNWLGDIVMALPALATIRRQYPDVHLAAAVPEAFSPLMDAVPFIDSVVWVNRGGGFSTAERNARGVRAGRFDIGILLTNSFATALTLHHARVPERWGYDTELRGRLLTRAVVPPPNPQRLQGRAGPLPPMHQSTYFLRLLQALGMKPVTEMPALDVPHDHRERGRMLLERYGWDDTDAPLVAVAPGAAYGSAKRWPAVHVAALVRSLVDAGLRPVLVGSRVDQHTAEDAEMVIAAGPQPTPQIGRHFLNLTGKTELAQLMAVLLRTEVVVSNDSGAMHLAAALGRPVVALFGPTDERVTSPLGPHVILTHHVPCRPCLLRECPIDHGCLRDLTPDEVFKAVEAVRAHGAPPARALGEPAGSPART